MATNKKKKSQETDSVLDELVEETDSVLDELVSELLTRYDEELNIEFDEKGWIETATKQADGRTPTREQVANAKTQFNRNKLGAIASQVDSFLRDQVEPAFIAKAKERCQ